MASPSFPPSVATTVPAPVAGTAAPECVIVDGRADARCTPGAVNLAVTQASIAATVCLAGWSATVRPPTSYTTPLKQRLMVRYGVTAPLPAVELDHLIALSSGGSPTDPRNLFPQLWDGPRGAHVKDIEEGVVHRDVCAGRITLGEGQAKLLADWTH